jgi:hypothetical protein
MDPSLLKDERKIFEPVIFLSLSVVDNKVLELGPILI